MCPGWWFGTFFILPYIGLLIIPIDVHIFQRGGPTTNQCPVICPSKELVWESAELSISLGWIRWDGEIHGWLIKMRRIFFFVRQWPQKQRGKQVDSRNSFQDSCLKWFCGQLFAKDIKKPMSLQKKKRSARKKCESRLESFRRYSIGIIMS